MLIHACISITRDSVVIMFSPCVFKLLGPNYPTIDPIVINPKGVEKLLSQLNPSKASGPDQIPCRILKGLSEELAPVVCALFNQSLDTGILPYLWSQAYVTPVVEKGQRCMPEHYRPVSLTCVSYKLFEHIICKHIRNHLDHHGILTPLNMDSDQNIPVRPSYFWPFRPSWLAETKKPKLT